MLNEWAILNGELQAIDNGESGFLRVGATPSTTLTPFAQAGMTKARSPAVAD